MSHRVRSDASDPAVAGPGLDAGDRLTRLMVAAARRPDSVQAADFSLCESILHTPGHPSDTHARAIQTLLACAYARPDLTSPSLVPAVGAMLTRAEVSDSAYQATASLLSFLLSTEHASAVAELGRALLDLPDVPEETHAMAVDILADAVLWAPDSVDLEGVLATAARGHMAGHRDALIERIVEPLLLAAPGAGAAKALARIGEMGVGSRRLKYLRYLLRSRIAPAAGDTADEEHFPLHGAGRRLRTGKRRVLIVQNIADAQGDEIVRVGPLQQALLDCNPELEVVLVTNRGYLYAHPRVTTVPFGSGRARAVLGERFDAAIDFFESNVPEANHDLSFESLLQRAMAERPPYMALMSDKDYNYFLYRHVRIGGTDFASTLGLDRCAVDNVYDPVFRLLVELGLPVRLGEEQPGSEPVLAGLPSRQAAALWDALTRRNAERRPVALLNLFGGVEPLKGYPPGSEAALADHVGRVIAEGFYAVLLPNGTAWGTAAAATEAVGLLPPEQSAQVVVGPDPAAGSGAVILDDAGGIAVPYASYVMHLHIAFVRCADLVVCVEGWMAHAAFLLGKPFRTVMMPYSSTAQWQPLGRSRNQRPVAGALGSQRGSSPSGLWDGAALPPLEAQPRKQLLLALLRGLGELGDPDLIPPLRFAARSPDRDVRFAAVTALGHYADPDLVPFYLGLIADPYTRVRGAAVVALLESGKDLTHLLGREYRDHLRAMAAIGADPSDWRFVVLLGPSARVAVEVASRIDENPVIRREASQVAGILGKATRRDLSPTPKASRRPLPRLLRRPPGHAIPEDEKKILILTPLKDAAPHLDGYAARLLQLTYPHHTISIGLLESDSRDSTLAQLERIAPELDGAFRRARFWKKDFGLKLPERVHRGAAPLQPERRAVLARSRNHLLFRALDDEDWVLWLDADVIEYPPDILERLLAAGKDIVQPHCVLEFGGRTFDKNAWRDRGRVHMDELRGEGDLVPLDAVGGTMLLVRADLHRDGLIFPAFPYGRASTRTREGRGELETEGLGVMAHDMGYECWGMPNLEIRHERA